MTDITDAARRIHEAMALHAIAKARGYFACKLMDGRPVTNDTFPSRAAARRIAERKTSDPLIILEVQPDGGTPKGCQIALDYERMLYSRGCRTPDALETEENSGLLSIPEFAHDRRRMARQLITGKPLVSPEVTVSNLPAAYRKRIH